MAERILVTGGAGYLGSVICERLLAANHPVTVLDSLLYGPAALQHLCPNDLFEFVHGDARDERVVADLVKRHDVLLPLACIVGAPACDRDPWLARSVNVEAIRLLNRLRSPQQLVIFPTTNSGYGTKTGAVHCTEDTPLDPISLYGVTKAEAERMLLESANTITLRLATVFGMSPRMRLDLLVNHFVYAAITDRYIVIFEKHFKRNFVHIRDVADAFAYCISNPERMVGRAYNCGLDNANLSKEELAIEIKKYIPDFYIHFSEFGQDPDKRNYIVSNQRLREAGFEAMRDLGMGIRELMKGYRMLGRMPMRNV